MTKVQDDIKQIDNIAGEGDDQHALMVASRCCSGKPSVQMKSTGRPSGNFGFLRTSCWAERQTSYACRCDVLQLPFELRAGLNVILLMLVAVMHDTSNGKPDEDTDLCEIEPSTMLATSLTIGDSQLLHPIAGSHQRYPCSHRSQRFGPSQVLAR